MEHSLWKSKIDLPIVTCSFMTMLLILPINPIPNSHAQVTADTATSSSLGTVVTPGGNIFSITGGTRPGDGKTLFHGFEHFSIGDGQMANFLNDHGLPTDNILSRVTGGNPSTILGKIKTTDAAQGFGEANFYLMNPQGIIFGPNAQLDVGGSFYATTANRIELQDGQLFKALPAENDSTLLTSAKPEAFGFLGNSPGSITVNGSTLEVPDGESLVLIGGDIDVTSAELSASGGRVLLVSTASSGRVISSGINVSLEGFDTHGAIGLSDGTAVETSGEGGGSIVIRGGVLTIEESVLASNTEGDENGLGFGIDLQAEDIFIAEGSEVSSSTFEGEGQAGIITIAATESVLLTDSIILNDSEEGGDTGGVSVTGTTIDLEATEISSSTFEGEGQAGDITLTAEESISLIDSAILNETVAGGDTGGVSLSSTKIDLEGTEISSGTFEGEGQAGNITLTAEESISLTDSAVLSDTEESGGNSGNITLTTASLELNQSGIGANTSNGDGNAGNISITATDSFTLTDVVIGSRTDESSGDGGTIQITTARADIQDGTIEAESVGEGQGGNVDLTVRSLTLRDSSTISTRAREQGHAGNIKIMATGEVLISGAKERNLATSRIISQTSGEGNGGQILVDAARVTIHEGGRLNSRSTGVGNAGGITINALETVTVSGEHINQSGGRTPSSIDTRAFDTGNAGSIQVEANQLTMDNGGRLESSTNNRGAGGSISVTATDSIFLTGPTTLVTTESSNEGAGGTITFNAANDIQLHDGATISAKSTGMGPSGNVSINSSGGDVFLDGGIITTEATQALGGDIAVQASENVQLTNNARVSAKSTGENDAGSIDIESINDSILLNNSTITTESTQAAGGDIKLTAPNIIQVTDSQITSSVAGGPGGGGDIDIDPKAIILNNSQILAQAVAGPGGNISLTADVIFVDPFSTIDASSALGTNGLIDLQAPIQNLEGTIAPLPQNLIKPATLYSQTCAAQKAGQFSSFVQRTPSALPPAPQQFLASPILSFRSARAQSANRSWDKENYSPKNSEIDEGLSRMEWAEITDLAVFRDCPS